MHDSNVYQEIRPLTQKDYRTSLERGPAVHSISTPRTTASHHTAALMLPQLLLPSKREERYIAKHQAERPAIVCEPQTSMFSKKNKKHKRTPNFVIFVQLLKSTYIWFSGRGPPPTPPLQTSTLVQHFQTTTARDGTQTPDKHYIS